MAHCNFHSTHHFMAVVFNIASTLFYLVIKGPVQMDAHMLTGVSVALPVFSVSLAIFRYFKREAKAPNTAFLLSLSMSAIWVREWGMPKQIIDPMILSAAIISLSFYMAPKVVPFARHFGENKWLYGVFSVVYVIIFTTLPTLRYINFRTEWLDLGYILHPLWNTLHGAPFEMALWNGGFGNRLGDHFTPILFLFIVPYALLPHPAVLYVLNCLTTLMAAFFLVRLMRLFQFQPAVRFSLFFAFLFNFPLQYGLLWDFHCDALAGGFVAGMFYFSFRKKTLLVGIFFLLSILTKEHISVALVPVLAGLMVLSGGNKKWFSFLMAVSLFYFFAAVHWLVPYFNQGKLSASWVLSVKSETDTQPIVYSLFSKLLNPSAFFRQIITLKSLESLILFFSTFLFLPLRWWGGMLLLSLFILKEMLQGTAVLHNHHWVVITTTAYLSIILFFKKMDSRRRLNLAAALLVASFTTGALLGEAPWSQRFWRALDYKYVVRPRAKTLEKAVGNIPKGAPVIAQSHTAVHLAHRRSLYLFPNKIDSNFTRYIILDTTYFDQASPICFNQAYRDGNERFYFNKTMALGKGEGCTTLMLEDAVFLFKCVEIMDSPEQ